MSKIMKTLKEDKVRERRITDCIVVDAYGPEERAMGWYCYLYDTLKFPFRAVCVTVHPISPLRKGEVVEVIGMPPGETCESDMLVTIKFADRTMAVPLSQLESIRAEKDTKLAIEDWHYWVRMGYLF